MMLGTLLVEATTTRSRCAWMLSRLRPTERLARSRAKWASLLFQSTTLQSHSILGKVYSTLRMMMKLVNHIAITTHWGQALEQALVRASQRTAGGRAAAQSTEGAMRRHLRELVPLTSTIHPLGRMRTRDILLSDKAQSTRSLTTLRLRTARHPLLITNTYQLLVRLVMVNIRVPRTTATLREARHVSANTVVSYPYLIMSYFRSICCVTPTIPY